MSLVEQIQAIEQRCGHESGPVAAAGHRAEAIPTGWSQVDAVLGGGLIGGALHEWFGVSDSAWSPLWKEGLRCDSREAWSPPVCLLVHLVRQVLAMSRSPSWVVWVGARCFPYPAVLAQSGGQDLDLLERSLFVAPHDVNTRLWAVDLALRSSAVGVVIANGSAFSMAATRRVQLLAKRHQTPVLTVRPPWERQQLSAAQTRWWIRRQPYVTDDETFSVQPRWIVQLLRCKGVQWQTSPHTWALEWQSGTSTVRLSPEVAHPARPAAQGAVSEQREPYSAARSA